MNQERKFNELPVIPDEFSDDDGAYFAETDQFAAADHPSQSSRLTTGSKRRDQREDVTRKSNYFNNPPSDLNSDHQKSSVISEVVEERIVELSDSDNEIQENYQAPDEVEEYLDVNQEEYLNRNEYNLDENSRDTADQFMRQTYCDSQTDAQNKYIDFQPIQEAKKEEELTSTPQNPKNFHALFKKKYPNTNNKLHLVWERERIARKRQEHSQRGSIFTIKNFTEKEPPFSTSTARGKLAEYDFSRPSKKKSVFVENLKSSVPILSDHYRNSTTHKKAALGQENFINRTFSHMSQKKMRGFEGYIDYQKYGETSNDRLNTSLLENMKLQKRIKAGKDIPSAYTPSLPTEKQGRSRMFYTSQIL
ncbi:unnamed protein product [Moneuplotes crassus]|uniref:Uncharacterized protein n=1 Tax=Euplotes crassus TaxID=5936 RepID=A0AAD2CW38_EUPCR|nr:unnamed protein product [Moneuplotes crassus]